MDEQGHIHIGTSGFHYKHWLGNFYPESYKPRDYLPHYLQFFNTVELNNPFYHLPPPATFDKWRTETPSGFIFAVKGSRYITHVKKLKDTSESVDLLLNNASHLKNKLGPVLFQLPPKWNKNTERLENFVSQLPQGKYRFTIEFRNHTWYHEEVYHILRKYNVAFCIYELEYHMSPLEVTTDFVYIRLHGPTVKYAGRYSESALQWWADALKEWSRAKLDTYLYFDNDWMGYAAFNGIRLRELCGQLNPNAHPQLFKQLKINA